MKLSMFAKKNSLTYNGAWKLFKRGGIPGAYQLSSGTVIVPEVQKTEQKEDYTVVYARVSSSENKSNLDSQADRLVQFCTAKGWIVNAVIKECASGLNDKRPKLCKLLSDKKVTRIVVEHKDRLTRFGFNYLNVLMTNCNIVVVNEVKEDQADLMQDFVNLVTSFCARLYGHRRSKRNTEKLIAELKND